MSSLAIYVEEEMNAEGAGDNGDDYGRVILCTNHADDAAEEGEVVIGREVLQVGSHVLAEFVGGREVFYEGEIAEGRLTGDTEAVVLMVED